MPLSQDPRHLSMAENLSRLMSPHTKLDERVFAADGRMLPEIRTKLLHRAQALIVEEISKFPWLRVDDIILFGSSVRYEYHELSDLDLAIKISLKSGENPPELLYKFINLVHRSFINKAGRCQINGRRVEVKPQFAMQGTDGYSVLRDAWLQEPLRRDFSNVNPQEVIRRAEALVAEIRAMYQNFPEGEKVPLPELERMRNYYNQTIKIFHGNTSDWLAYKLAEYTGEIHRLRQFFTSQIAITLSF